MPDEEKIPTNYETGSSSSTYIVCSSGGTSIRCRWNAFAVTHGLHKQQQCNDLDVSTYILCNLLGIGTE